MQKGILLILDGYGEGKPGAFNAVENANTPTLKSLKKLPHSLLKSHGEAVGLFEEELGGSEVGHMTIGAGRIVKSTAKRIRDDIQSKDFEKKDQVVKILNHLEKNKSDLHLIGLMSDKNIHSDINHCLEIINIAKDKAKNIYVHFITDGRDSGPIESEKYLKQLKKYIKNIENCSILSVSGRFYAMDRENRTERIDAAFNAFFGQINTITNVEKYIKEQHSLGKNDQYIDPVSVKSKTFTKVKKEDCLFFFNFREDRLRQMVKKCEELKCQIFTMANVAGTKSKAVYSNEIVKNTLSEYLSKNNLKHIKIGESTKYAHVTYFLNGGKEQAFPGEDRVHVESLAVDNFAKTPKMKAKEITDEVEKAVNKGYDAVIVNYSNPDMVGHTGDYDATVKALEFVDKCVKRVLSIAKKNNYFVMLTSDHGNADEMRTKNGEINMAHSINPTICVIADGKREMKKSGGLKDVAPTFIELMGLKPNKHFEGESLIV